jgi:acetoin:2,6-dichlorophenolindophenol oxidoreductase subunit alpha
MPLSDERTIDLYRTMYKAQRWELGLLRMMDEGLISGFYHAGRGHEGTEVAAVMDLRPDDYLLYDHRGCAHMIAKGMDLVSLYGDFLANDLGSTRGLGAGIVHICDPDLGVLGQSGTIGEGFLIATGAALSAKLRGTDQVAVNFSGDGAANRGPFHEAANVAGAWKLPVVFIIQNNGWAVSVPVSYSTAGGGFAQRGAAYDMPGVKVDGMNPFEVHDAVTEAVDRARRGEGPTLIEAMCVRLRGHFEGDPGAYREDSELAQGREHDPVPFTRNHLIDKGISTEEGLARIESEVDEEVRSAADRARGGKQPGRDRLFEGLYV